MSLNYPVFFKTQDIRAEATIRDAVQQTITNAQALWAPEVFGGVFGTTGFGIKRLQPSDLNGQSTAQTGLVSPYSAAAAAWVFSMAAGETWQMIVSNCILSNAAYIIICGIFNYDANPDMEAIKITADGIEYPIIDIQEIYGWDVSVAYFSHPIVVRPEKKISIEAKSRNAGQKNFGFIGYTVAKRSYLITKI